MVRTRHSGSDREAVMEVFDDFDAVVDKILGLSFDAMTPAEKLALYSRVERNLRPTVRSRPTLRLRCWSGARYRRRARVEYQRC